MKKIPQEQIDNVSFDNKNRQTAFLEMCRVINATDCKYEWVINDDCTIRHEPKNGEFSAYFWFDYGGSVTVIVNGNRLRFDSPYKMFRWVTYTKDMELALRKAETAIQNSNKTRRANSIRRRRNEEKKVEKMYMQIQNRLGNI